ncbi:MAG TPA: nuclear transport factor 2 family protein [Kofleriaceae bacterium]|nr:nuclear transport factor 2 family protein [Kofleriaceae bacterium]
MKTHLQTVQNIYAAFGRGDVPAILEVLADDVDWEYGGSPSDVPWLQPGRGREAAARFFGAVGANLDVKMFAVNDLLEGTNVVVGLVSIEAIVKPTGRTFREVDEVHIWRFDEHGRVNRFRHAADTAQQLRAFEGR